MKVSILFLILFSFQIHLEAQKSTEDYLGSWYSYSFNHRVNEHFSINPYSELRFYEPSSNYNLVFLSVFGNYHINRTSTIGLGYAFLDIDTVFEFDHTPNVKEHRLSEHYVFNHKAGKLKIQHRFRLEQRFLDFAATNDLQNRFRYRLQFKYEMNKTFYVLISNEPFVNFQDQVFHENRFYSGIGINVLKHSKLEIGYLKQNIRKNNLNRIHIGIRIQTSSINPKPTLAKL